MRYRRTSPARFLAPIAVLIVAFAVYTIVNGTLSKDSSSSSTSATTTTTTTTAKKSKHKIYVVRSGDTLAKISARTGISLDHLETYNPSIDPNQLHAGERLKLRPSGQ